MQTETAKKPNRINFMCSDDFKHELYSGAAKLDISVTELLRTAAKEYLIKHPKTKAKSQ